MKKGWRSAHKTVRAEHLISKNMSGSSSKRRTRQSGGEEGDGVNVSSETDAGNSASSGTAKGAKRGGSKGGKKRSLEEIDNDDEPAKKKTRRSGTSSKKSTARSKRDCMAGVVTPKQRESRERALEKEIERLVKVIRVKDAKLIEYEEAMSEETHRLDRVGKQRYKRRNLLKDDPANQQNVNNFITRYWFPNYKFLPEDFYVYDEEDNETFCAMFMSMCDRVPGGYTRREYWYEWLCGALAYKMQMVKNQRLQKVRNVVRGE